MEAKTSKWPKTFPPLTPEQRVISDDFMQHWHHVLAGKFSVIDQFNHGYVVRTRPATFVSTLEIGAGNGEHLSQEPLSLDQKQEYVAVELRQNMADELAARHPDVKVFVGD